MSIITEKRRKTNSCFGYNERLFLEGYLSGRRGFEKITKRKRLAEIFGCDRKTIYNNRMLRRFFPKGCDFSKVTDKEVEEAVGWMNNYPRKIHNGLTPLMLYDKCCNF